VIPFFTGTHRFLSNFYPSPIEMPTGETAPTVEHAYQAWKTEDREEREVILLASSPGAAKRLGRRATLRPKWEGIKLLVMEGLVRQKFQDKKLRKQLVGTGDEELVEGNSWGDTYWGVCGGVGSNHLGKILMKIRAELRASRP